MLAPIIPPTAYKLLADSKDLEGKFPSGQKDEGPSSESGRMSSAQAFDERNEESQTFA
jgi:hypothetical protein